MKKIGNWYHLKYQISDLNGDQILKDISLSKLKKESEILIIDDEEFTLLDDLKKHEFSIEYKSDITSLKDVEQYPIILCDIHGVGKFLGSSKEGAYLVYLIKEKYPSKVVISYTADTTSPDSQKYLHYADNVIPKGTSIEDWASLLNDAIKNISNPVNVWKKIQLELIKANVSTRDIACLEDGYVKAIKKGEFDSLKKLNQGESGIVASIIEIAIHSLIKILK